MQGADLVSGELEDGEMGDARAGTVSPADEEADHVERGAQGFALEDAVEGGQAGLGEEHFAEAEVAVAGAGVSEAHVEFDEKGGGGEEVVVGPELGVVHDSDAAGRVADVEREPDFLQRRGGRRREEEALAREQTDDLVDDTLAIDDHAQPAKAGHEAGLVWDSI